MPLARGGTSAFHIVVSTEASPSERYAASELQRFLKEVAGAELPVLEDDSAVQPHEILVGDSAHLGKLGANTNWEALGAEARLPIQHVELEWLKPQYRRVGDQYCSSDTTGAVELAKTFVAVAERNGVTSLSEGVPPSWHVERLALWSSSWPAVRLENELLRVDIVPGLGGRIVSLFHKGKRRELLLEPQPDGREYPRSAGYEEYSERGWRSHGCQDKYDFHIQRTGRTIALWADLPNGLRMERTWELSDTQPLLTLESHLANVSNEPKPACLRIYPMFRLGPTEQVAVTFTDIAATRQSFVLRTEPGQLRGQLFLEGDKRPNGQWEGANAALQIMIRQRFDTAQVNQCQLDWLPSRERFNLELASPEKILAPGESIQMRHQYDVVSTPAAPNHE